MEISFIEWVEILNFTRAVYLFPFLLQKWEAFASEGFIQSLSAFTTITETGKEKVRKVANCRLHSVNWEPRVVAPLLQISHPQTFAIAENNDIISKCRVVWVKNWKVWGQGFAALCELFAAGNFCAFISNFLFLYFCCSECTSWMKVLDKSGTSFPFLSTKLFQLKICKSLRWQKCPPTNAQSTIIFQRIFLDTISRHVRTDALYNIFTVPLYDTGRRRSRTCTQKIK